MTGPRATANSTDPAGAGKRTGDGAGTRSTVRRELVTNDLLEKATALFAEKGYEATSLQDVADAMGISRPALYHYVSSKEEVLGTLVVKLSHGLAASLEELRQREGLSAACKLRQLTELLVRERAEAPGQFRILDRSELMLPEPMRAIHLQARRDVLAALVALIDEGIADGDFKPLDSRVAALSVLGMCNWVAWWFRPGPGHEVDPVVEQISQSALDMLTAHGSPAPARNSAAAALAQARSALDTLERFLPTQ